MFYYVVRPRDVDAEPKVLYSHKFNLPDGPPPARADLCKKPEASLVGQLLR